MNIHILSKIITLIISLLFISCTGDVHYTPSMRKAEQIMDTVPDSARILLSRDSSIMKKENKPTRMYYDMLLTLAKDKCYIPHTSDSIMLKVVDYYQYHGTPRLKFMSYYLLGRIYTDMNLTADAFDSYNKALSVKDIDSSFIYVARANNQIGHLYMYQDMYRKALPYFYATYKYAVVAKDISVMVFALRDIGRCNASLYKYGIAYNYYRHSVTLIDKTNALKYLHVTINPEFAYLCLNMKRNKEAKDIFIKADIGKFKIDDNSYYLNGGDVYRANHQLDSAIYYYKKCLSSHILGSEEKAAYELQNIYLEKKDYYQSLIYAMKSYDYAKIKTANAHQSNQNLIKSLSDKILIQKENYVLRKEKEIITSIVLTILLFIFLVIIRTRKTIKQKNERFKKVTLALKLDDHSSQEEIIQRIQQYDEQIEEAKQMKDKLKEIILQTEKENHIYELKKVENTKKQADELLILFRKTSTYKILLKKSDPLSTGFDMTSSEWDDLYIFLNTNCYHFVDELQRFYSKINQKELIVCCLIKLSFNNSQIANIFNQTQSAISNLRKRLYRKMFNKEESADELDKFLYVFPYINK